MNVTQTTTVIAHYVPSGQDSDGDGVKDWFELYQFGDLSQGPADDPDGDGFSNQRKVSSDRRQISRMQWRMVEYPAGCRPECSTSAAKPPAIQPGAKQHDRISQQRGKPDGGHLFSHRSG